LLKRDESFPRGKPALDALKDRTQPRTQHIDGWRFSGRRFAAEPFLDFQSIKGGLSPGEAFVSLQQTVVTTLHDANEASLDEDMLLAA
jgi:hypothetical protein